MNKLLLASTLLALFLSGCGTSDGACCESMAAISKNISPDGTPTDTRPPFEVKSDDPITKKPPIEEKTPPVAVITTDVQPLVATQPVFFSCTDSYDTDENGDKIIACEWTFECHQNDGSTCKCDKKGNPNVNVGITPNKDADYIVAILTVTDDEGETNTTSMRYDVAHY